MEGRESAYSFFLRDGYPAFCDFLFYQQIIINQIRNVEYVTIASSAASQLPFVIVNQVHLKRLIVHKNEALVLKG